MARSIFTWDSGEIAIAAGVRKGILGISGSDNYVRAVLKRFGASCNGVVAAGKPVLMRLCVAPQALAAGTSLTVNNRTRAEYQQRVVADITWATAQFTTAKHSFTVPTTNVQILRSKEVHPNGGDWEPYPFLIGEEPEIVTSTWSVWIDALGDTVLSVDAWADIEE